MAWQYWQHPETGRGSVPGTDNAPDCDRVRGDAGGGRVWRADLPAHRRAVVLDGDDTSGLRTDSFHPTPFAYTLLLQRTAFAFCFLLPFGLVGECGYATPFLTALGAYAFFGLDALGDEMEEPFGNWPNALPLSAMARMMKIRLLEATGEKDLPAPLLPVNSVPR